MVGTSGIEPPTTTMSRWCSTTELRACNSCVSCEWGDYSESLHTTQQVLKHESNQGKNTRSQHQTNGSITILFQRARGQFTVFIACRTYSIDYLATRKRAS